VSVVEEKRRNLGRGLSAQFGDSAAASAVAAVAAATRDGSVEAGPQGEHPRGYRVLDIGSLRPGKYQPRKVFDEDHLGDLVESVREKGILTPILVRPLDDGFEIIAGERRWRAAQRAQLHEVPVIVRDLTDKEALEVALVENLQRHDLNALEEAEGYVRLISEFGHTQEQLAKALGKSRSHVANVMRLLNLPQEVREMVEEGYITPGHARALLTSADPVGLARLVCENGLTVRQAERLAQDNAAANGKKPKGGRPKSAPVKDADTAALERDLTNLLGCKVAITAQGKGGELTIHYGSLEQLDDILSRLTGE
jgi:ParB family chromosome partitioning protein